MDFVDLDKVLDQFEEEEKAAEEILPGQEIRPSGYAEYLVSQQDRPWENLSLGQPLDTNSKQLHLHSQTVAYDDPYDSLDRSGVEGFKQLGFPPKNSYIQHQADTGSPGHSHSLEHDLAQAKLKEEKIEAYLPALHLSNGVGQGPGVDVNGWVEGGKGDEGERRGLIASQPASIQTDMLSPASEKELLSHPLPKSDILVEGHGQPPKDPSPTPALPSTPCPSTDTQPTTNYASTNGTTTPPPASTQHLPQDTEVKGYLCIETGSSQPSLHQGMEKNTGTGGKASDVHQTEPSAESAPRLQPSESDVHQTEPSAQSAPHRQPSEQPVEQQGTAVSLQQELALLAGVGAEAAPAEKAVGFESEESDMDRDEVDAYLEELESGMLAEECAGSEKAGEDSAGDSVGGSLSQDSNTTSAAVQSFADSGGDTAGPVQTSHRSLDGVAGDGGGADRQTVDMLSCEDIGDHGVTVHRADGEDRVVVSERSDAAVVGENCADVQHPHAVADLTGPAEAAVRTDVQPHCGMDTEENRDIDTGGGADNTSIGLSDSNKTEASSGVNMNSLVDTTSLQFPVAANKSGVSSIVKGKLEIEGLLDEIAAARLAHKSSEVIGAGEGARGQAGVERTVCVDGEKRGTEGWGPEGSMVCGMVREASPEVTSPSPTLGVGARPKDPSHLKKSRPNSLLGLSKISLTSPFSPPQHTAGPVIEVMLPTAHQPPAEGAREGRTPFVGVPPPEGGAVAPSHTDTLPDQEGDSPVMRRSADRRSSDGEGVVMGEGEEASSGAHRPQSWSPSTLSSPPTHRTKRPTSLNLPVRQDRVASLSPDGDNTRSRKAGVVAESGGSSEAGSSEEEGLGVGGTDGDMGQGDPQQDQEGAAAAAEFPLDAPPPSILHQNLGKIAPTWLPDADAPSCMECTARFTFTKRRHHCRACGKIFCSTCCCQKSRLTYLENKEGRVCVACHHILSSVHCVRRAGGVSCRSPNPNNPIEYCSTVPPTQQANARAPLPTVMVPTGVLKRHVWACAGSNRKSEPKQVMFSDGIRPGGDLTELDGSDQTRIPPRRSGRPQKKVEKQQGDHSSAKTRRLRGSDGSRNPCLIPDEGLPPVVVHTDQKGEVSLSENTDPSSLMAQIRNEEASPVIFAINLNLFVKVKIINLDCCLKRVVWCFTTQGMVTVGQEELVVVLETLPDEDTLPRDIFCHFSAVYQEAGKGNTVSHMGHSIFSQAFLDSGSHGGFLYLRASFQCTTKLPLPDPPFLFPILLHKWETPWAKVFPIRLMLRLGAEHRYYPCPLVSIRGRKPVFFEIGHTIMNLLADFRNFQYMLQQIRGVSIHMEDQKTFINFPRNRYHEVMKVVSSSNEHVMALGASFSLEADSHLVCIQNEDGNYQTQAINIQNKPRQVTGASFVVFNGALKSSAGLRGKSSIVEDGLMVQILPETMGALKQSLKDMQDFVIPCGSLSLPDPEEVVTLRWVNDDKNVNTGVKSPVDGMSLEGVDSVAVHNATDYVGERLAIRWTQLFFLQTESGVSRWEPVDLSRVAETLANAVCIALTPHLPALREAQLTKIALRVTLQPDSVGYEVGSNGERLPDFYMKDLDNALIPVIHGAIAANQEGPIVLELHLYVIH